jgi:hypothetical protein
VEIARKPIARAASRLRESRLRPFFHRYGSKWRGAPHYPCPVYDTIVEAFCGAAGYSLLHPEKKVLLFDSDEIVCGVWHFLIHASEAEIRALQLVFEHVDDLIDVCQEARWLMGFWLNKATTQPSKSPSAWMRRFRSTQRGVYWSAEVRERLAQQQQFIRHWTITRASYRDIPDMRATWFVDAPYIELQGRHYKHNVIDYHHLGDWCKSRRGQVIVCEGSGADWLRFVPLGTFKGQRKRSQEMIWTNDEGHPTHHPENELRILYLDRQYTVQGLSPVGNKTVDRAFFGANRAEFGWGGTDYTLHFHAHGYVAHI